MTQNILRIAHLADTHLGFSALTRVCPDTGRNQRAVDIERAFEAAIDHIVESGDIDLVIHAGDVFHHSRPPMHTLIFFVRQLRRLEAAGIPTIVIGGNHDTPRLRNVGSVLDLCAVACSTVRFAAGYDWDRFPLTINNQRVIVTAIPHGAFTNEQPPNAFLAEEDAVNILVAHGSYNLELAHDMRGGADEIDEALLDARYAYIALGHWHGHERKKSNVWYSGSTERIGLSDLAMTPGYARVTLSGSDAADVEQIILPARAHEQLPTVWASELTADEIVSEVIRRVERVSEQTRAEALIVCSVRDTPLGEDRAALRMLRAHDTIKACWAFVPDIRSLRAPGAVEQEASPIGQLIDEFNGFVSGRETAKVYETAFAATFRETGTALLEEALQRDDEAQPTIVPATAAGDGGAQ